jgi:hypothetical protein
VPGVYVSYPFCAQKCTYCNFASGVFPRALEERYRLALAAEIRAHAWQWQPETVYLGGATPSSLPPGELASFLTPIPGRPWLEATIEAAPGSLTPEKARAWAALGIDRVSLGVQSFVENEIRRTGRRHTAEIVAAEVATLRDAGIPNCNIDLIAGLSGQTAVSWRGASSSSSSLTIPSAFVGPNCRSFVDRTPGEGGGAAVDSGPLFYSNFAEAKVGNFPAGHCRQMALPLNQPAVNGRASLTFGESAPYGRFKSGVLAHEPKRSNIEAAPFRCPLPWKFQGERMGTVDRTSSPVPEHAQAPWSIRRNASKPQNRHC